MTKIAFLCSTLQAGKDGVGDYVLQFARNLTAQGHECLAIALADRFVHHHVLTTRDTERGFDIVRVSARNWEVGNTRAAEAALSSFAPDWVSLQMVCYGYENRGLLLRSAEAFARLRRFGRGHLMFHELWIGESTEYGVRQRAVGWLQKRLLLRATKAWSPDVVHTSNPLYRELLRRNGVHADELPLPGNIPICSVDSAEARSWLLEKIGSGSGHSESLLAGGFGSIHPEWGSDCEWLDRLEALSRSTDRRLVMIHLGKPGAAGGEIWKALALRFRDRVEFHALGELSPAEISRALLALDLGVATSPWPLIGKSGSVAAMLEHGIPVLVTRTDFALRHGTTPEPAAHPLLYRLDDGFAARMQRGEIGRATPRPARDIYQRFMSSLQSAPLSSLQGVDAVCDSPGPSRAI